MTEELKLLTADEMRAFADAVVDIAAGLGDAVTVVGLSGGGVLAAWMAQFRVDVETAIVVAPAIGILATLATLPLANASANRLVMHTLLRLPNLMTRRVIRYDGGLPHGYIGFATRGLGAMMRLGFVTLDVARRRPPAARRTVMVINESDRAMGEHPRARPSASLAGAQRPSSLRLPLPGEPGTDS